LRPKPTTGSPRFTLDEFIADNRRQLLARDDDAT
jgi:hypothetical protein